MEVVDALCSPQTQQFYRKFATVMSLFGMGNSSWWGYEAASRYVFIHKIIIVLVTVMSLLLEIIYLVVYYNTIPSSSLCILFLLFPLDCLTSIFFTSAHTKSYKKIMKMYINKIHLFNHTNGDNLLHQKVTKADYYTRIAAYGFSFCTIVDCLLWYAEPLYNFYQNKAEVKNQTATLGTVLYWWVPYDYKYNIKNWAITYAIQVYTCTVRCVILVVFNILNFMFIFHLIGHVQILKHRFRTEFSTPLSDFDTKNKLISLIRHHSFIIEVFQDTQKAFGYAVTANYCYNLLCDSLLIYKTMQGEIKHNLVYGVMFSIFMGQLLLMSLVFEEIRRENDDLADVVYSIPWEKMSISNQKTVMMIPARAQRPLEFVSAFGLRAGIRPAIAIIKSTFSYYVMLKSSVN